MSITPESEYFDNQLRDLDPSSLADFASIIYASRPLASFDQVHGLIDSRMPDPRGSSVVGITNFQPSFPQQINIVRTIATGVPLSRKKTSTSSPVTVHGALDAPRRLEANSGVYSLRNVGALTIALVAYLSSQSDSDFALYTRKDGPAKKIFRGNPRYAVPYINETAIATSPQDAELPADTTKDMVDLLSVNVDKGSDAVVIVSDFLEGYSSEEDRFDWEDSLLSLAHFMGDRLMAVRLDSPAQTAPVPGQGLPLEQLAMMHRRNAELIAKVRAAQELALGGIRHVVINGYENPEHPIPTLVKLLTEPTK